VGEAYKMAEVFARESNHMVKLAVVPGEGGAPGHISLASVSAETGDNAGVVDAIVEGEAVEVVLNARYVLDVLPVVSTPQVALEMTAPTSLVALRPVGDDAYTYVMMPMHTDK
jgi:DNA polymerase-3 subunit beta